jgi:hypothetical protein
MRIFAIGDPHLSLAKPKPMWIFGEHWRNHDKKIAENWASIAKEDDLLLIVGDISWAMRLEDALLDLDYIAKLKGKKIILKGNHDFWWPSKSKLKSVLAPSIDFLQASSLIIDDVAIVGTRAWQTPGNDSSADMMVESENFKPVYTEEDYKIYKREVERLKQALESLKGKKYNHLIIALHYPPFNSNFDDSGFTELIDLYKANTCVYGHLHGESIKKAFNGKRNNTYYQLVSADSVDFTPKQIF